MPDKDGTCTFTGWIDNASSPITRTAELWKFMEHVVMIEEMKDNFKDIAHCARIFLLTDMSVKFNQIQLVPVAVSMCHIQVVGDCVTWYNTAAL